LRKTSLVAPFLVPLQIQNSLQLTGIVHQDVDRFPAKGVERGTHARGRELRIGHVSGKRRRFSSGASCRRVDLGGDAFRLLPVEVGDEDAGPVGREEAGRGCPEALAGAGDDGDLETIRVFLRLEREKERVVG
jgi:hypothetical protein